jgi:hypothetical protein
MRRSGRFGEIKNALRVWLNRQLRAQAAASPLKPELHVTATKARVSSPVRKAFTVKRLDLRGLGRVASRTLGVAGNLLQLVPELGTFVRSIRSGRSWDQQMRHDLRKQFGKFYWTDGIMQMERPPSGGGYGWYRVNTDTGARDYGEL